MGCLIFFSRFQNEIRYDLGHMGSNLCELRDFTCERNGSCISYMEHFHFI